MEHTSIRKKILKHLEGLNELEKQTDSETLIQLLAERYNTPEEIVKMAIAEWQSGG